MEDLKRVYVTQDDDGHKFVIPYEFKDEFQALCEKSYSDDDFEEFIEKFGQYATGGDINLIELYARV